MSLPTLEQILEVIAEVEPLEATRARFPGLEREELCAVLVGRKKESSKREVPKREVPKREVPKREALKPEVPKPEVPKPEALKPEALKPEALKPEVPKPEALKPEPPKPEALKPEALKPEALKPEPPKPEALKRGTEKSAAPTAPPSRAVAAKSGLGLACLWTDGASRGNPGPASVGVVIENQDGERVAEVSARIGIRTNNYAEYEAVRRGLERAAELGAEEVHLRADSELIIRQLTGVYRVKNADLIPLFDAVKALERRFPKGVRYQHVRREQNAQADALANLALDNG